MAFACRTVTSCLFASEVRDETGIFTQRAKKGQIVSDRRTAGLL